MLSGIGPAQGLKSHGITPILDHPGVGKRLVDHPVIDVYFKNKHNSSMKWLKPKSLSDVWKVMGAVFRYHVLKTGGPLAMNVRLLLYTRAVNIHCLITSLENVPHSCARMTLCYSPRLNIPRNW